MNLHGRTVASASVRTAVEKSSAEAGSAEHEHVAELGAGCFETGFGLRF